MSALAVPVFPAGAALVAAALLLTLDNRPGSAADPRARLRESLVAALTALAPLVALVPLAAALAFPPRSALEWPALVIGLVIAMLARVRSDLLHNECALKLLWVMGGALALSWAGLELLVLATGTHVEAEQWAVLELGIDPRFLWSTALPLSLLVGLVLLGGAPFHFWAADLFQGVRPWLAPLAVAALQVSGGGWLERRLAGVGEFPAGAQIVEAVLWLAALIGLLAGAATLVAQRRPERRVGTLASVNGALLLASLTTVHGSRTLAHPSWEGVGTWGAHLVLALTGAATAARFMPAWSPSVAAGPVLFRRHPWSGSVGLFALLSLSAVPGTPGSWIWLSVARDLAATGRESLLLALGIAWLAAFATAVRELRQAFGVRVRADVPEQAVPWQARGAMWVSGGALVALAAARLAGERLG